MYTLKRWRYPFLIPALLLTALTFIFPLGVLFNTSMRAVQGYFSEFVGLSNYRYVLSDPLFTTAVLHNLLLLVICVPIIILIAIFLSVFLMEEIPGARFYRTVVFIPYILSVPVISVVFGYLLQPSGPINNILGSIGLGFLAKNWLGSPHWALFTLIAVIIWKELGFGVILFYARLIAVPKDLLEAASLDGAGWWRQLWHILIPQLRGVLEFYTVVEGITMLSWVFNYVYIISDGTGGPGTSTMVTELYIYQSAFGYGSSSVGIASAASTVMFIGTLILIVATIKLQRGEED